VASFDTLDLGRVAADFRATIQWGDSRISTPTPGTIRLVRPGHFEVVGSHTFTAEGAYLVTVTVADAGGVRARGTSEARVADLSASGRSVQATAGRPFSGVVATFSDPGGLPTAFKATINWGDTTTSSATIRQTSPGHFANLGSHAYARPGVYVV